MTMFVSTPSAEGIREANSIVRRSPNAPSGVTAAGVFALWILIPWALGGLAYILLGMWVAKSAFDPEAVFDTRVWLILTLLFQTGYWMLLARSAGLSVLRGLWALIPVVALIPTFSIARAAARTEA